MFKKAFTLVEVMVVVFISAMVFSAITFIWMRTGTTAVKGSEMMDLQIALRTINERLRSDIRTMHALVHADSGRLVLHSYVKGERVEIRYEYNPADKTLRRHLAGQTSPLNSSGLIDQVSFEGLPTAEEPDYVQLSLKLVSPGQGSAVESKLAQVMTFSSQSIEHEFVNVNDYFF